MTDVPAKVLVLVDDEESYVELLAGLLAENLACRVVTFTRPLEALAALPSLEVGLIVTDYYMPGLNGFEFVGRASRLQPGVPFILITGHTIDPLAAPASSVLRVMLQKPFGWRKLADEVVRHWPGPERVAIRSG